VLLDYFQGLAWTFLLVTAWQPWRYGRKPLDACMEQGSVRYRVL